MGLLSNRGYGNRWFAALDLPAITPPGGVRGRGPTSPHALYRSQILLTRAKSRLR